MRGRLARSSVDTRNSAPAPSASDGGDDRRVDPEKAVLVEEAVDRLRQRVAHARRRADHVGARPQVRHLAQELHGVRLGLDRIGVGVVDPADHLDRARLHLERLALGGRRHDRAGRLHRAAGRELQHLVGVVGERVGRHHLHRMERRAVREVHERDAGLGVAPCAHPALDGDRRVAGACPARIARTLRSRWSMTEGDTARAILSSDQRIASRRGAAARCRLPTRPAYSPRCRSAPAPRRPV